MGAAQSEPGVEVVKNETPSPETVATLYYFAGRGLADQIRWMLAATGTSFTQKVIDDRQRFLKMAERQLPFGQLPLLQIDGIDIVQSQAAVRYLARRANIDGESSFDKVKCEMIAETVRDLINVAAGAPFQRNRSPEDAEAHVQLMREKWTFVGARFEAILAANGGVYLVGSSTSYVDILLAHLLTWYVEECGADIVSRMPRLVDLQIRIIELPSVSEFIKGPQYFSTGDAAYCEQVSRVLGRKI